MPGQVNEQDLGIVIKTTGKNGEESFILACVKNCSKRATKSIVINHELAHTACA